MRHEVAKARTEDNANQHGDERHKRQNRRNHGIDGLTSCLIERRDNAAHHLSDLCHKAAGLLGDLLRRIVLRSGCRRSCIGCGRCSRRCRAVAECDIVRLDRRDVDILLDVLGKRTGGSRLLDVHRKDALLRVDTAAQRAATVNDHCEDLLLGDTGLEAIHNLCARHLAEAKGNIRDDPARNIDDFMPLLIRRQCERTAKSARTCRDNNAFILCHGIAPFFLTSAQQALC